jgi:biopolymer transport protein ExbB
MKSVQGSIKEGNIDEAIASCDKQQGSQMQLNLL